MSQKNLDGLIDAFVRKVNGSPRRRIREEDVPRRLREGGAEFGLYYDWTIQRFKYINWIDPLEAMLPAPLPPAYRSLVTRYLFPAFEISPVILLANTGQTLYHEMSMAMTRDKVLSNVLLKTGYAQFARPSTGDSDPVCFDFNRKTADGECPIVRISHHSIVFNSLVNVMEEIAPSFYELVDHYVKAEPGLGKLWVGRPG
jgi:hypothetical protein